jgi:hypothetical protein
MKIDLRDTQGDGGLSEQFITGEVNVFHSPPK